MKTTVPFESILIAPCGIYCGVCYAYIRDKNRCDGCRVDSESKFASCQRCIIVNCALRTETSSGFCYECPKFPCQRLKQLDKRYRTKYNTSLIGNLQYIRDHGVDDFLEKEKLLRTCPGCGTIVSIHSKACTNCMG